MALNTTEVGRKAEKAARVYLDMRGFKIVEQNWRRPAAEIDIIATKNNVVHFVEVRYRETDDYGGGLETITKSKLHHMQRAAYLWVAETKWTGEFTLSVIEVAGREFSIMSFVEDAF